MAWVAYNVDGKQLEGAGLHLGEAVATNNEAEATAMLSALSYI